MRRIILWLAATATAITLLMSYRTSTSSTTTAAPTTVAAPATTGADGNPATDPTAASVNQGASNQGASNQGTGTTSGSGIFTGTAVNTRYGPVQVQIVVSNGAVTKATAIQYPDSNGRDQQINSRAIPQLNASAVTHKGKSVDTVSGATYTSHGYLTSLQSALDKAGL